MSQPTEPASGAVPVPAANLATLQDVAKKILASNRILVTCHLSPDGDSTGSMVALCSLLRGQGKNCVMYNPDLIPRHLKWLPHVKSMSHRLHSDTHFDCTIVLDCGDAKLLGENFPDAKLTGTLIAIDHHPHGRPFGDMFLCDPSAASVGVLVARLAKELGWPLTSESAKGIYVSLVTDTGWFRYLNTSAEALRLAAELVESGLVTPNQIHESLSEDVPLSRYKLLSSALAAIELGLDGRAAFMMVTQQMVQDAGATWEDSEGLVNYVRAIRGVECGVLLCPAKRGGIRVSMRARSSGVDVGAVCLTLGGGGHKGAAGCVLSGTLAQARVQVEQALLAALSATATVSAGQVSASLPAASASVDTAVVAQKPTNKGS